MFRRNHGVSRSCLQQIAASSLCMHACMHAALSSWLQRPSLHGSTSRGGPALENAWRACDEWVSGIRWSAISLPLKLGTPACRRAVGCPGGVVHARCTSACRRPDPAVQNAYQVAAWDAEWSHAWRDSAALLCWVCCRVVTCMGRQCRAAILGVPCARPPNHHALRAAARRRRRWRCLRRRSSSCRQVPRVPCIGHAPAGGPRAGRAARRAQRMAPPRHTPRRAGGPGQRQRR